MRAEYPSDISREQFARIQPLLEGARKKTKPRKIDLYDVFCAILYTLRTGCQWRALPSDFPKWGTVYSYYQIWGEDKGQGSLLERVLKKSGVRNSQALQAEMLHHVPDSRRPECEEHGHGAGKGL